MRQAQIADHNQNIRLRRQSFLRSDATREKDIGSMEKEMEDSPERHCWCAEQQCDLHICTTTVRYGGIAAIIGHRSVSMNVTFSCKP
jgi:hypothetical protein